LVALAVVAGIAAIAIVRARRATRQQALPPES
jgi:hypothetical protein